MFTPQPSKDGTIGFQKQFYSPEISNLIYISFKVQAKPPIELNILILHSLNVDYDVTSMFS